MNTGNNLIEIFKECRAEYFEIILQEATKITQKLNGKFHTSKYPSPKILVQALTFLENNCKKRKTFDDVLNLEIVNMRPND